MNIPTVCNFQAENFSNALLNFGFNLVICDHPKDRLQNVVWMNPEDMKKFFGSNLPKTVELAPFIQLAGQVWQVAEKSLLNRGEIGLSSSLLGSVKGPVFFTLANQRASHQSSIESISFKVYLDPNSIKSTVEKEDLATLKKCVDEDLVGLFMCKGQEFIIHDKGARYFLSVDKIKTKNQVPLGVFTPFIRLDSNLQIVPTSQRQIQGQGQEQGLCSAPEQEKQESNQKSVFWRFPNKNYLNCIQSQMTICEEKGKVVDENAIGVPLHHHFSDNHIRLSHRIYQIELRKHLKNGEIALSQIHLTDKAIEDAIYYRKDKKMIVVSTVKKIKENLDLITKIIFKVVNSTKEHPPVDYIQKKFSHSILSKGQRVSLEYRTNVFVLEVITYQVKQKKHAYDYFEPNALLTKDSQIELVFENKEPVESKECKPLANKTLNPEEKMLLALDTRLKAFSLPGFNKHLETLKERLLYPLLLPKYSLSPPVKGIILHGPPGCGKTILAENIAHLLGCTQENIKILKMADLKRKYYGETENILRNAFAHLREGQDQIPLKVLIIDEIEALIGTREEETSNTAKSIVSAFLGEMDVDFKNKCLVIGTTNYIDQIDPAAKRPGRMGLLLEVAMPNQKERKEIFEYYLSQAKVPIISLSCEQLAAATDQFTGAMIKEVVHAVVQKFNKSRIEARLNALKGDRECKHAEIMITVKDFQEAIEALKPKSKQNFKSHESMYM